jgi:ComEC/Rec2-related protein
VAGCGYGTTGNVDVALLGVIAALVVAGASWFVTRRRWHLALVLLLLVCCGGIGRGALAARPPAAAALADHPRGADGPWRVRGTVRTEPYRQGSSWVLDLAVDEIAVDGLWRPWPLRVRTTVYDTPGPGTWIPGSGFETFVSLRPQRGARNPLVPRRPPLRASGADVRASLKSLRQLRRGASAPIVSRALSATRAAIRETSARRFGAHAPLVNALLLGERGAVAPALTDALARTGLIHLYAISGLHVAIIVSALFAVLRLVGMARPQAAIAVLCLLPLLYGLVVARPPVARACLMAAALLTAVATGRRSAPLGGLALATLVITGADPWVTRNFGFQLSTGATAAILLLVPPPGHRRRILRVVASAVRVSCAAQLAVVSIVAATTFRVPVASIVLNVIAVPAMTGAIIGAMLALAADALHLGFWHSPQTPPPVPSSCRRRRQHA